MSVVLIRHEKLLFGIKSIQTWALAQNGGFMKKLFQIKFLFLAVVAGAMLMVMFMVNTPVLHASSDWYEQQRAEDKQRDAEHKQRMNW